MMIAKDDPRLVTKDLLTATGQLRDLSLLGGYPILYVDEANNVLCAVCATEVFEDGTPLVYEVYDQVSAIYCDACGTEIAEDDEEDMDDEDDEDDN